MAENNPLICYCLLKRKAEVISTWQKKSYKNVEQFMEETKMGTVCTACRSTLKHILLQEVSAPSASVASGTPETLYSNRKPHLSPFKKFKKSLHGLIDRYTLKKQKSFDTFFRLDNDFTTKVTISNLENNHFPKATVDLEAHITCYDKNGNKIYSGTEIIKKDGVLTLEVNKFLEKAFTTTPVTERFGLMHMDFFNLRKRDGVYWMTGTVRPYLTLEKNQHVVTVHEKSVWFDTPRALPGFFGSTTQEVIFGMASLNPTPGTVTMWLKSQNHEEKKEFSLLPYGALQITVPPQLGGEVVDQVELQTSVSISGYQFIRNLQTNLFAVQHLVKEGN